MHAPKPVGEKLTIGLDLGDRRHHACVVAEMGDIVAEEALVNTREDLSAFGARYPGGTCVMETAARAVAGGRVLSACVIFTASASARTIRAR